MSYSSDSTFEQVDPYATTTATTTEPPKKRQRADNRLSEQDDVTVLKEKVFFPVEKHPGYNFLGPLLGPSGCILKELTKVLRAKIMILGKGSMKDKKKEEELSVSEEAEHAHLKEALHVLIEIKAPRAEAHHRMANALAEIYTFMIPSHEQEAPQHFEHAPFNGFPGGFAGGFGGPPPLRGRGGPPPRGGRGGPRGGPRGRGGRGAPRGRGAY